MRARVSNDCSAFICLQQGLGLTHNPVKGGDGVVNNMLGLPVTTICFGMGCNRKRETLFESMLRPLQIVREAEIEQANRDAMEIGMAAPQHPRGMRQALDQDRGYNRYESMFLSCIYHVYTYVRIYISRCVPTVLCVCACMCIDMLC